jgi:nitroreductase
MTEKCYIFTLKSIKMTKKNTKIINGHTHIRYQQTTISEKEMLNRSIDFYQNMDKRRSIRDFSDKPISKEIIENIIKTAGSAPSGAHKQPWTFCIVENPVIKKQIRLAAEAEERQSYDARMSDSWLKDIKPMGTDASKPFIEIAPYLIVVFKHLFEYGKNNEKLQNYYVNESVGIACGMLIAAIQNAGLVTLTHTPSPMRFLEKILNRPDNERAFLLLPIGKAIDECFVPKLQRKAINEISEFY